MNKKTFVAVLVILALVVAVFELIRLDIRSKMSSGLNKSFPPWRINDIAQIDPNLILYKESSEPIRTGFNHSSAIAVALDGIIYIGGDRAIRMFFENGQMRQEIKLADEPRCLAVENNSKIYVGMKDHVEVYNSQGEKLTAWQSLSSNSILTSIAVSKNDVFVADAGNRVVIHYDGSSSIVSSIGKKDKGKNILGFIVPSPYFDLAIGPDGLLRVANPGCHRIEAYTFNGDLEFWWGKFSADLEGFTGCCNPVNFAMLEDGTFVTCEKGLIRVKIYAPDGSFLGVVAGPNQLVKGGASHVCYLPEECQSGGFDVAVDTKGRVFVLDTIKNVVRIFSRKKAE